MAASLFFFLCLSTNAHVPPRALVLRDLNAVEHRPFADQQVKAAALIFILPDCPIANSYAPEIKRLCDEYQQRGVRFYLVHVDPDITVADAKKHGREFGHACPIVLDKQHELVRRAGATKVPEVAVFTPDGQRQYRGRIDDLYVAPGKRREQPTVRELRLALDALLAGRAVERPVTEVVGCRIPPLQKGQKP
jgi:AhpC/TSA family